MGRGCCRAPDRIGQLLNGCMEPDERAELWPHRHDHVDIGVYGNFGQSNYGAAKTGVWGLMNTLHIEGAKNSIHVNCIAPTAATRMTEDVIPEDALKLLDPK